MTSDNDDEFRKYLVPTEPDKPVRVSEVPSQIPEAVEKAPSGLAPMSRVELEGRAYRGMAGGNIPWWVLISGVVFLVLPAVGLLLAAIVDTDWSMLLLAVPFLAVFLAIVGRGISAKLRVQEKRQNGRPNDNAI